MLKKRITAVLVVKDQIVVQSIAFRRYLPVGSIDVTVEFLSKWGIDEIVLLDISATQQREAPRFDVIERISSRVFVPLTVGGGITTLDNVRQLVHAGADKVALNSTALANPQFVTDSANVFGVQCIVVSMDVRLTADGSYEVFGDSGKQATGRGPVEWAQEMERRGAGEILVNAIDRDGMKNGYDLELLGQIVSKVRIPVIFCGGVGKAQDFAEGIRGGASAVAAANYFHFTEHSPIILKSQLASAGLDIRLDTHARYDGCTLEDTTGRLAKRDAEYLKKLRFEYQKDEFI